MADSIWQRGSLWATTYSANTGESSWHCVVVRDTHSSVVSWHTAIVVHRKGVCGKVRGPYTLPPPTAYYEYTLQQWSRCSCDLFFFFIEKLSNKRSSLGDRYEAEVLFFFVNSKIGHRGFCEILNTFVTYRAFNHEIKAR